MTKHYAMLTEFYNAINELQNYSTVYRSYRCGLILYRSVLKLTTLRKPRQKSYFCIHFAEATNVFMVSCERTMLVAYLGILNTKIKFLLQFYSLAIQ